MQSIKNKAVVITGPTASGKSSLAVELALEFEGEIISADSRQVYKGMDIGSGKITRAEMKNIPHHLLDVADPARDEFSVADFIKLANIKLSEIAARGRLPIIVGGTGLYITALTEGYNLPEVPPDSRLREHLSNLEISELQKTYQQLDPEGFEKIDTKNPVRLIRAIEVVKQTGRPFFSQQEKQPPAFDFLILGVQIESDELRERIAQRLKERFAAGMLEETIRLHQTGVSWERLESFGLEYKYMAKLAKGEMSEAETLTRLQTETTNYAKRQKNWWKRKNVIWVKSQAEAAEQIKKFLN